MTQLLARLKPYDGKRHVRKTFTVFGIKFDQLKGWYKVDDDVAAYLKTVKQRDEDPDSPPAFNICTEEEALLVDESEAKKEERRKAKEAEAAKAPVRVHNARREDAARAAKAAVASKVENEDLTTADLRKAAEPEDEEPNDMAPELSGDFDEDMTATTPKAAPAAPAKPAKGKGKGKAPPQVE